MTTHTTNPHIGELVDLYCTDEQSEAESASADGRSLAGFIAWCILIAVLTAISTWLLHGLVRELTLLPPAILSVGCMYLALRGDQITGDDAIARGEA